MKDQNIISLLTDLKIFCTDNNCEGKNGLLSFFGFKGLKDRVATVREKSGKNKKVREKSENFLSEKRLKTKRKISMASQGIFNFLVSGNPEGAICISCYLLRFKKLKHDSASIEFQK